MIVSFANDFKTWSIDYVTLIVRESLFPHLSVALYLMPYSFGKTGPDICPGYSNEFVVIVGILDHNFVF